MRHIVGTWMTGTVAITLWSCVSSAPTPSRTSQDAPTDDQCLVALGVDCKAFYEARLEAPEAEQRGRFGEDVALSGDTLAVTARACPTRRSTQATLPHASGDLSDTDVEALAVRADESCSTAGVVHLFRRSRKDGGWTWAREAALPA